MVMAGHRARMLDQMERDCQQYKMKSVNILPVLGSPHLTILYPYRTCQNQFRDLSACAAPGTATRVGTRLVCVHTPRLMRALLRLAESIVHRNHILEATRRLRSIETVLRCQES